MRGAFVNESGSQFVNEFSAGWNLTIAAHALLKADHSLSTSFRTQLFMAWHNMAWLTEWFTRGLTFVPVPRNLSPEAESTTDSTIQSIDKPILRVSHAMLCQGGPRNVTLTPNCLRSGWHL